MAYGCGGSSPPFRTIYRGNNYTNLLLVLLFYPTWKSWSRKLGRVLLSTRVCECFWGGFSQHHAPIGGDATVCVNCIARHGNSFEIWEHLYCCGFALAPERFSKGVSGCCTIDNNGEIFTVRLLTVIQNAWVSTAEARKNHPAIARLRDSLLLGARNVPWGLR